MPMKTLLGKTNRRKDRLQKTKTEALHAFRTITTMLHLIRSTTDSYADGDGSNVKNSRKELKILNALATIGIRDYGVVAVVAAHNESGSIQVLVTYLNHNEGQLIIPQPAPPNTIMDYLTNFRFARNPDPLVNSEKEKTSKIIDPGETIPPPLIHYVDKGFELLTAFLTCYWTKFKSEDTQASFVIHIWMINKLLQRENARPFSLYVIAACYPKALRRLGYRNSQSYLTSLENLKKETVTFSEKSYNPQESEIECDSDFLSGLEVIEPFLGIKFPKLMDESKKHHHNFYTEETFNEFQTLLCALLEKFFESLKTLDGLRSEPVDVEKVVPQLDLIARVGTTLRSMVRGVAIKKHLQVIENFLPDRTDLVKKEDNDDEEGSDNEEGEESPKWMTCRNWLELVVLHFDAIQDLAYFVKKRRPTPNFNLNMRVLSPDHPNAKMLTWRKLLESEKYFPKRPGPTAQDLINFLDPPKSESESKSKSKSKGKNKESEAQSVTAEDVVTSLRALCDGQLDNQDARNKAVDDITNNMQRLTNCTSPGSGVYIQTIAEELKLFKERWALYTEQDDTIKHVNKITAMIRTLRDNAKLRAMLKKGALLTGDGFTGNVHAEAWIAANCKFGPISDRFSSTQSVGVSTRCCPFCAYLLKLSDIQIAFTGTHHTYYPCSLPESLPSGVIDAMVIQFGGQLRDKLVELFERTGILHACDRSIDSRSPSDSGSANTQVDIFVRSASEEPI